MDYKERLRLAKEALESGSYDKDTIEYIFPELKESEDEKIRKEIINYFKCQSRDEPSRKDIHNKWIAWLEKQGKNNMGISEATKQKLEDNLNKALEKETPESWNEFLDGQGEQNHTDKAEPKFHKGDWIINSQGTLRHIINVDKGGYQTDEGWLSHNTYEKTFHLWTIQDAKDGDVLCCESGWTCIFKALDNHTNTFSSYCFMDSDKWFCNIGIEGHTLDKAFIKAYNGDIHPATKEQRDLLFQKMKEAGYRWNSDEKKMEKIEKKPADKAEPKFKVGDKIKLAKEPKYPAREIIAIENNAYYFDKLVHLPFTEQDNWELVEQKPAESKKVRLNKNMLKPDPNPYWTLAPEYQIMNGQKPAEWSEEDERYLNNTISYLKDATEFKETAKLCIDWLKSLKERVQPKQEWSEEDKRMLNDIYHLILLVPVVDSHLSKENKDKMLNWLKFLRPKNNDNWNDMSIKPVFPCDILYKHPNGNVFLFRYLEGGRGNDAQTTAFYCLDENGKWMYLKDVEPQNHWKPSEEQMYNLDEVIRNTHLSTAEYNGLIALREQFKAL